MNICSTFTMAWPNNLEFPGPLSYHLDCLNFCLFVFFPLLTLSKFSKFKVTYLKQLITNNIHFTAEFRFTILELIVMT